MAESNNQTSNNSGERSVFPLVTGLGVTATGLGGSLSLIPTMQTRTAGKALSAAGDLIGAAGSSFENSSLPTGTGIARTIDNVGFGLVGGLLGGAAASDSEFSMTPIMAHQAASTFALMRHADAVSSAV